MSEYKSWYATHLIFVIVLLVVIIGAVVFARSFFLPQSFNKYGHYRAGAIRDEIALPVRNQTNESCLQCHEHEKMLHLNGVHKTVSCEFCHGPNAMHVRDGKVIARMPRKQGEEIKTLCLRCHNKIIRARPKEYIKMVSMPDHLRLQHVQESHNCNQCHLVHAPLRWIKEARESMGFTQVQGDL